MGDAIYIAGVPLDSTEQELVHHFGQLGALRVDVQTGLPCVWIYKDIQTGQSKGDALVCYQDPYTASSAVQWFHQKPMRGSILHVSLTQSGDMSQAMYPHQDVANYPNPSYNQMWFPPSGPAMQQPVGGAMYAAGRGQGRGMDASRGRGRKITAAPQGPARLFGPDDWPCPSCGNTNWARRPRCNLCGAPKPGTFDMRREGQAGGFKEVDEKEAEEDKRRRKAMEEADDGELYDDYGRIKKRYRNMIDKETREKAALARLCGDYNPSPSAQELAFLLGKEEKTERASEDKKEETKEKDDRGEASEKKGKEKDDRPGRSTSPRRYASRDGRERSVSPRHRSRRHSQRESDAERRGRHRSRDYDDRKRSRR